MSRISLLFVRRQVIPEVRSFPLVIHQDFKWASGNARLHIAADAALLIDEDDSAIPLRDGSGSADLRARHFTALHAQHRDVASCYLGKLPLLLFIDANPGNARQC